MVLSLAACGSAKTEETAAATTQAGSSTAAPAAETTAAETKAPAEAAEPLTLNIAYMPNYGSLWSVAMAVDMDASGIVTAMISGGVDACATWSPNSLKILEEVKDSTKLCDNLTFADTMVSLASWIVTPKYAEANRDNILRFTRALHKAMDYAAAFSIQTED